MFKNINKQKGIGTIEVLISLLVIVSAVTAVVLVVAGNQDIKLDNDVSNIALYRAGEIIGKAEVAGEVNFNSIISSSSLNGIFTDGLKVLDQSPCRKDITASVSWEARPGRFQNISLTTSLVSREEALALGLDCDLSGGPVTEWWFPFTFEDYDLKSMEPPALQANNGGVGATSIDVIKKDGTKYSILTTKHSTEKDIWVINVDDGHNAFIVSALETEVVGLNDADVAGDYVFALTAGSFGTQPSELQIIDISTITAPSLVATKSLGISGADSSNNPNADAIYYYDGKIYIGTHRTGGAEFKIYSATAPFNLIDSLEITHNVNEIIVRGDYAYLATSDNSGELMVVDINSSSVDYMIHPDITGMRFNAPGLYDGSAIDFLGNKIYLGRERASHANDSTNPNFYILNVTNPSAIIALGSKRITRNPSQVLDVLAINVVSKFAFLGTSDSNAEFQAFRIDDPLDIRNCDESPPPGYTFPPEGCGKYDFPAKITDLEYHDNLIYASIESNATFRIIFDDPSLY
ncbi:MAG: hypothetical protein Q8R55_05985 [Candidatus Taylorbacteria bacterium]|nr:hypothetical protein [Candidatus Taylorbacteria bacterium]